MRDVGRLAGRVHHDEYMIAPVGQHEVISDTAGLVGKETIPLAVFGQPQDIDRNQRLKRARDRFEVRPTDDHLSHVADIEQPRLFAGMSVFFHHAQRILHRHLVTRKGHHSGTQRGVQIV